jgi:predicted ribosome quality control (RQC) complex YloA/Tae2 family protein
MIEWLTNRLNALVIGPDDVIRAILAPREGERRNLTAGALYELPPPTGRRGTAGMLTEEEFIEFLAPIEPAQRSRALLRGMAYVSPLNANAILGPALLDATEAALLPAWTRYRDIVSSGSTGPCTFAGKDGPQPYPVPLPGVECTPAEDLFAAFDRAETEAPPGDPLQPALDRLDRKRDRVQSRLHRLREEAAGAAVKAERLRRDAGLLLSQPHAAPRGTDRTILDDFDGGSVEVELDPALSAAR